MLLKITKAPLSISSPCVQQLRPGGLTRQERRCQEKSRDEAPLRCDRLQITAAAGDEETCWRGSCHFVTCQSALSGVGTIYLNFVRRESFHIVRSCISLVWINISGLLGALRDCRIHHRRCGKWLGVHSGVPLPSTPWFALSNSLLALTVTAKSLKWTLSSSNTSWM